MANARAELDKARRGGASYVPSCGPKNLRRKPEGCRGSYGELDKAAAELQKTADEADAKLQNPQRGEQPSAYWRTQPKFFRSGRQNKRRCRGAKRLSREARAGERPG